MLAFGLKGVRTEMVSLSFFCRKELFRLPLSVADGVFLVKLAVTLVKRLLVDMYHTVNHSVSSFYTFVLIFYFSEGDFLLFYCYTVS